jgi:hypothetical protein
MARAYSQKNRWSIFPVAPPFPTLKPSRYRIHRQACRRGGTGAGCEGETQNLTVRVRENGLPPGLATIAPCACHRWSALDVPEAHKAVAKIGRRTAERPEFGHKPPNGALEGAILLYSIAVFCSAPSECSTVHGGDTGRKVAWGFGVSAGKVLPCDTPLCPAGHLPLRWGDRLGAAARSKLNVLRSAGHLPISLLVGEMPGRAEGGAARHNANRNTHTNPPRITASCARSQSFLYPRP